MDKATEGALTPTPTRQFAARDGGRVRVIADSKNSWIPSGGAIRYRASPEFREQLFLFPMH